MSKLKPIGDKKNEILKATFITNYKNNLPIFFNGTKIHDWATLITHITDLLYLEKELKEYAENGDLMDLPDWTAQDIRYFSYDIVVELIEKISAVELTDMLISELVLKIKEKNRIYQ